jgi:hypothetical protein
VKLLLITVASDRGWHYKDKQGCVH